MYNIFHTVHYNNMTATFILTTDYFFLYILISIS